MGATYVCENGVSASTQGSDETAADGAASGTVGPIAASAYSTASRTRYRASTLLLSAILAAAMHTHLLALPFAVLGMLAAASAASTSLLSSAFGLPETADPDAILTFPESLSPRSSCANDGALSCGSGGGTFFLCSKGVLVDMGNVTAGTVCENGVIVAAQGYGGAVGTGAGIESAGGRTEMRLGVLVRGLAAGRGRGWCWWCE